MATPREEATARDLDAALIYAWLAHRPHGAAATEDAATFELHALACLLSLAMAEAAASESETVAARLGLGEARLAALIGERFPGARGFAWLAAEEEAPEHEAADEIALIADLLRAHATPGAALGPLLADIIARRMLEGRHLWEDLGLAGRGELSRLMAVYFEPLAVKNVNGMRWKRFLYRELCAADGFVMCTTPVCSDCAEFELCFGEETAERRLAETRAGR